MALQAVPMRCHDGPLILKGVDPQEKVTRRRWSASPFMVQDPREYSDEAIWGVVGVGGVEGVLNVKLLVV